MSSESGELHVSHGVHYEEHHGVMATLAFGQELNFCAGSEMHVVAGMESAFAVGAENKVGIATNATFELGAEVRYVRGWAVEIAHEGGGAYENAFTATAGSSKIGAFKTLQVFMGLSVLAQVAAVATMLTVVKTNYVQADGKLAPEGESGAKTTLTVCQNVVGVVMFLGTVALNSVLSKLLHVDPLAAVTVNHESEAFIGVKGSLKRPGTGGIELSPNQFKISAGQKNRDFRTSGHEVVGYDVNDDANTRIVGNNDKILIQAKQLQLKGTSSKGALLFTPDQMHAWVGGDAANTETSLQLGLVQLAAPNQVAKATKGIRLAVGKGSAVSMAGDWVRVSVGDGTELEIEKGKQVKLSYANSSASVVLSQSKASLNFGTQFVKMDTSGVDLAGVITILNPAPGIPDAKAKITVNSEVAAAIVSNAKEHVQTIAEDKSSDAYNLVMSNLTKIKRSLETKISQATTKAGAV